MLPLFNKVSLPSVTALPALCLFQSDEDEDEDEDEELEPQAPASRPATNFSMFSAGGKNATR